MTAVREVFEETGHHVQLGRRIATVSYPIDPRTKKVQYWSARSIGGSFAPNNEVDDLIWLSAAAAIKKVSYRVRPKGIAAVGQTSAGHEVGPDRASWHRG